MNWKCLFGFHDPIYTRCNIARSNYFPDGKIISWFQEMVCKQCGKQMCYEYWSAEACYRFGWITEYEFSERRRKNPYKERPHDDVEYYFDPAGRRLFDGVARFL
jgi:hypothetical protein